VIEGAALRQAIQSGETEHRLPYIRSFDVLAQYLVTLATGGGFYPEEILEEVLGTYSFSSMTSEEWMWVLNFIVEGGQSLEAYDDFKKVEVENGRLVVKDRKIALRHRLGIGTIVGDTALKVQFMGGGFIGTIEEYFISKLNPGDVFFFGGHTVELVRIKDMTVQVRKSRKKTGIVASWMGGRMPLSSNLSNLLRQQMHHLSKGQVIHPELEAMQPLIAIQQERSVVPRQDQFLVEYFQTKEGFHLLMYPYEGRFVHEGMAALLAWRIARIQPISFSIAMNDYGFELLSDQPMDIESIIDSALFSTRHLQQDILASINAAEMARRKFRDIAHISGLIFKGYPGRQKKDRHLQASAQLFFQVFQDYDPDNLLLRQAFEEVMTFQLEEQRLRNALDRISKQELLITQPEKPTPFSFPIIADRLNREKLSSETLEDRIKKMQVAFG
jgi:ATP-dependent Lhr-like helicase